MGPGCGGQSGFCDSGNCDSGGFGFGGRLAGCGADGGGTSANFSDYDCGPMCGAYLQDGQTSAGCGCDDCQVGQSYVGGQVGNWFGQGNRPIANSWNAASARVQGGVASMAGRFGSVASLAGPCRGLGGMVGCSGCGDCGGGGAIGTNHSACSTGNCGTAGCGPDGCGGVGGHGAGGGIANLFFRRQRLASSIRRRNSAYSFGQRRRWRRIWRSFSSVGPVSVLYDARAA